MNDLLLIRKKSILNSLNNIINSNKNLFETHKFNLMHNYQGLSGSITVSNASSLSSSSSSSIITSTTSNSSINYDSGSIYKLPCWLVEDCLLNIKENSSQYENYLLIQKIVTLIKEYFFNLIDYENKMDSYKRLNLVNEIIAEEESLTSLDQEERLNDECLLNTDENNTLNISNYANNLVTNLIQDLNDDFTNHQNQIDTNLDIKKIDSFAFNLINDLFNDNINTISAKSNQDSSSLIETSPLIVDSFDRITSELNFDPKRFKSILDRRHSADTSIPSRLSLLYLKEERKSASSTDSNSDLSTKRTSRFASLTTTHNIERIKCFCCPEPNNCLTENDLIIRRHSFNPSDLTRRMCLSQLANKTTERFNNFPRNHFRISFPTNRLNKSKSKAVGYANSDSNLNNLDETNKTTNSSTFKQYNKVVIKNILRKSNSKQTKSAIKDSTITTSCRAIAVNSDIKTSNDIKTSLITNSDYLKDLIDNILNESLNEIKLVSHIKDSSYTNDLNDSIFKDAFNDVIRLHSTNKKNQPYWFKCNCNTNEKDLSCLLTIYCMMIAVEELDLKNQITIVCSHYEQTF